MVQNLESGEGFEVDMQISRQLGLVVPKHGSSKTISEAQIDPVSPTTISFRGVGCLY